MVGLVLFDIDGTLIRTGGAGVKAFEKTFAEIFDLPEATKTLNFAGRTDFSLVRECFAAQGITATADHFDQFFRSYPVFLEGLLGELAGGICEGVPEFLDQLCEQENRPVIGLLTGNIRRGAELKLGHYNLWHRFETGAFSDDHEDRNCIASIAKQRGEEAAGRSLSGDEVVVIGDTPLDIACARSIQAKVLAVGTGNFSRTELDHHQPTWAVDHLGQISVTEMLGG